MKNRNPFIPLHSVDIKGATYDPTFQIEFGTWYLTYIQQPGGKCVLFDRKYRCFMWAGRCSALLVSIEPCSVSRMADIFSKAGETWYDETTKKTCVKLYKNYRSTPAQLFIRKVDFKTNKVGA